VPRLALSFSPSPLSLFLSFSSLSLLTLCVSPEVRARFMVLVNSYEQPTKCGSVFTAGPYGPYSDLQLCFDFSRPRSAFLQWRVNARGISRDVAYLDNIEDDARTDEGNEITARINKSPRRIVDSPFSRRDWMRCNGHLAMQPR